MNVIYLLGISHRFQFRPTKHWRDDGPLIDVSHACRFEKYLRCRVEEFQPSMLCEEACEPNADEDKQSVTKIVAEALSLEHRFCDPSPKARAALYERSGITEDQDRRDGYPVRERFWLDRIRSDTGSKAIFFVCGANHVLTFSQRLNESGIATVVICRDLDDEWQDSPP